MRFDPTPSRATWLLRRLGTVLLGLPLLYLVSLMGSLAGGAVAFELVWGASTAVDSPIAWNLALAAVLGSWAGLYSAVPGARFMLRVFPLRADGGRRWGVVGMVTLVTFSALGFALWLRVRPSGALGHIAGPERFLVDLTGMLVELGVLLAVYLRPESQWPGRRVLYLRRFRSFSDRVVYRALLAALPAGARLTALVPTLGGPRDLDPFAIGFTGMRWRRPVAGMPRTYVSPDDEWQSHVRRMMMAADCIVVDGSAGSASMEAEYRMIESLQLGARTLVLVDERADAEPPAIGAAVTLHYRRGLAPSLGRGLLWLTLFAGYAVLSWKDPFNAPRIVLGIFLLVLPAIFQRSVQRTSLRRLAQELASRVGPREPLPLPLARALGASLTLGLAVVLGLQLAALAWRPRPTSDARARAAIDGPMAHQDLKIGQQLVEAPVPAGFVNPKDLLVGLRARLAAPRVSGQFLAIFVPLGTVFATMVDGSRANDAVMVLWLPADAEVPVLDLADFAERYADVASLAQGLEFSGATSVRIDAADERSLDFSWAQTPASAAGEPVRRQVCAGALVLVRGKPLGMTLCRPEREDGDHRWTRDLAARWVREAQRRNPPMPPVRPGEMGMSGIATTSASVVWPRASVVTTLRIAEVVPGTPSWRAGLEPGDEIVAIDGLPLAAPDGQIHERFAALPSGGRLRLEFQRGGRPDSVELVRP